MSNFFLAIPLVLLTAITSGGLWCFIHWQQRRAYGQAIREDGPQAHLAKAGTPTGGGLVLWGVLLLTVTLAVSSHWLSSSALWSLLLMTPLFVLGLSDDWLKITKKKNKGVHGYTKLFIQSLAGLLLGGYLLFRPDTFVIKTVLGVTEPFVWSMPWLWAYPLWASLVVTATSNAVNLTDGLDGLAGSTLLLSFATLAVLPSVPSDLRWVCLIVCFILAGFLFLNWKPAKIFMGDAGSLFLGGLLASIALASGLELFLLLFGLVFVWETLSVILQVGSFKLTGKRIFKMAPFHHHLELSGLTEVQTVGLLWVAQLAGCALAYWVLA